MTTTADDIRADVTAWLRDAWDPELTLAAWWARLADSGWAAPTWPVEWHGRGLDGAAAGAVNEAFTEAGAPGPPAGLGLWLAGPTILDHGSDAQKRRYLRPILTGEEAWCQLFSEPSAGSDLAGLQTRAVRDGDRWRVTGQKVWTSGAHHADLGMLLARTDPDAPKHRGITWFVVAMDQPGIEVRPLRQMTGHTNFNEVFLEDAIVHEADAVGGFGNGWTVTLTTLAHERANLSARSVAVGAAGHKAGFLDRRAGDFAPNARRAAPAGEIAPVPAARLASRLMALARERGRAEDPVLRQDLARLITLNEISRFTSLRMKAARAHGRDTGPTASTMKLAMSHTTRLTADLGLRVLGPHGMLHGVDAPSRGSLQDLALGAPAASIAGGTDEIQRNIIGERVLGLPREPSVE